VRHHESRRSVETIDQQAAFIVHREGRRAPQHIVAQGPAPSCRRAEQRLGYVLIVNRLEEPEKADSVVVGLVVEPVTDGSDAADGLAVPLGDEVFRLAVLEEGVPGAGEEHLYVPTQRRDPERVPRMESVRKIDEALEVPPFTRLADAQAFAQITPRSLPMVANCSRAKSICSNVWVAIKLVRSRH
jgi:hypothetical protein